MQRYAQAAADEPPTTEAARAEMKTVHELHELCERRAKQVR